MYPFAPGQSGVITVKFLTTVPMPEPDHNLVDRGYSGARTLNLCHKVRIHCATYAHVMRTTIATAISIIEGYTMYNQYKKWDGARVAILRDREVSNSFTTKISLSFISL